MERRRKRKRGCFKKVLSSLYSVVRLVQDQNNYLYKKIEELIFKWRCYV